MDRWTVRIKTGKQTDRQKDNQRDNKLYIKIGRQT